MLLSITSKDNRIAKQIRSLVRKKARVESGYYLAEGVRICREALRDREESILYFAVSEAYATKEDELLIAAQQKEIPVYCFSNSLFDAVCDTQTPQGVVAVLKIPEYENITYDGMEFLLILDGVSDPGNLGTIIRTAEAAGVDAVLLLKGCADLYNPKAVRATMGSILRVPCLQNMDGSILQPLKEAGFTLTATALAHSVPIASAQITGKRALIIGSEAFGVSDDVLAKADMMVRIPMEGRVESLNAAVAAGIAMYYLRP